MRSTALNGSATIAVSGFATGATSTNTGVNGAATGGVDCYGGYFSASGGTNTSYAVYSDGDLFLNGIGTGSSGGFYPPSDIMFKTNIDTIANASGIIMQLQPKVFYYDTANAYNMRFSSSQQYGLIAQDVYTIMPELVATSVKPAEHDSVGNVIVPAVAFKVLNYNAFIAILIAGMQEQQAQIDSMQSQINSCCSSSARMTDPDVHVTNVTLTNHQAVVLNQNVPNPFAEQTTITYFLPETTVKAQMLFYDVQGKLIKAVDLEGTGNGQLNVFADDLTNGIYSYALVVDGQVMATKQMVKTK